MTSPPNLLSGATRLLATFGTLHPVTQVMLGPIRDMVSEGASVGSIFRALRGEGYRFQDSLMRANIRVIQAAVADPASAFGAGRTSPIPLSRHETAVTRTARRYTYTVHVAGDFSASGLRQSWFVTVSSDVPLIPSDIEAEVAEQITQQGCRGSFTNVTATLVRARVAGTAGFRRSG